MLPGKLGLLLQLSSLTLGDDWEVVLGCRAQSSRRPAGLKLEFSVLDFPGHGGSEGELLPWDRLNGV